jgi:hypothetical protein
MAAVRWLLTPLWGTGSVRDGKLVRHRTVLTGERLRNDEETLEGSPQKSLRRLSQQSRLSVRLATAVARPHAAKILSFSLDFSKKKFIRITE